MSQNEIADFLNALPKKIRKVKPKRVIIPGRYDLKAMYFAARKTMFERDRKVVLDDGHYFDNKFPDISTTNGTQTYISDCLNWLGHQAEKVNTMGIPMTDKFGQPIIGKNGKQKYRRGSYTTGSSDMPCSLNIPTMPVSATWKIEVKKAGDTLSLAQERYRDKILAANGLHSVVYVGDLDHFWDEYYKYIKL